MQTKFKRHAKVRLLLAPGAEYIEYSPEFNEKEKPKIGKGSIGKVNMILSNGQYHIEIIDEKTNKTLAYAPMNEDYLEAVE